MIPVASSSTKKVTGMFSQAPARRVIGKL